jgi:YD repeat-containing protein
LSAIADAYDNYIAIEYDDNDRISKVYDGERETVLKYDRAGRLMSVTDPRGRKNTYAYTNGKLTGATYADGGTLEFAYTGDELQTVISSDRTKSVLGYSGYKLSAVSNQSTVGGITDNGATGTAGVISVTDIIYGANECAITTDGKARYYYMDALGNRIGGCGKFYDGTIEEVLSFDYTDAAKDWGYTVKESDDAIYANSDSYSGANYTLATISAASLPAGVTEFVFSAHATPPVSMSVGATSFVTAFQSMNPNAYSVFGIAADVSYSDTIRNKTYFASFDYRNKGKQFTALPVTLDRSGLTGLQSVTLRLTYAGNSGSAMFTGFRFAPAEWEYREYDQFGNMNASLTSEKLLNNGAVNTYRSSSAEYIYDGEQRLTRERVTWTIVRGSSTETADAAVKYFYGDKGKLIRTESFVEDEERAAGIDVKETVYDTKGRAIKSISYNTLDSSTKFYSEKEYAEDGKVKADIDETGENRTKYEYAEGTNTARTQIAPNGGRISYGHDHDGNTTAITQSTEDGEPNGTETRYTFGLVTRLKSGLNTVNYEYDHKRRKTKVLLNGAERVRYAYAENITDAGFPGVTLDKATTTLENGAGGYSDTLTDKRGNVLQTRRNGAVMVTNEYNADDVLLSVTDSVTEAVFTAAYDVPNKRVTAVEVTGGYISYDIPGVTETYAYNAYGQLSVRTVNVENRTQTYGYAYKNNAAQELDYITLPGALRCYPQTDVNGRSTGKLITDASGNKRYGEYITYRKVGDHAANAVSGIRYGGGTSYAISDSLKYRYDATDNIAEVEENGMLSVRYSYDKLQRLIREDNKQLNKTVLWTYDNFGNILCKRVSAYTGKAIDEIETFTEEKRYAYDGAHPDRLVKIKGYDANGAVEQVITYSVIGKPGTYKNSDGNMIWDNTSGKLASFNYVGFAYDGHGRRVQKDMTMYTYNAKGRLQAQMDSYGVSTLDFIYDQTGLSGLKHGNAQYVYRKNAQGDITHILDTNGNAVVRYTYDAWGNHTVTDASGVVITDAAHIGNINPFMYKLRTRKNNKKHIKQRQKQYKNDQNNSQNGDCCFLVRRA